MHRQEQYMLEIDIAAYLDGRLTPAQREALVQGAMSGREEEEAMAIIESVVRDTGDEGEVTARIVQRARDLYPRGPDLVDLVISLANRAISVISASPDAVIATPAAAGAVRGREAVYPMVVMTKVFNRARVDVHVENTGGDRCQFTVQARDPLRDIPLENTRVDLVFGRRELASNPLEAGTTLFEDVAPGRYDLIVRKNDAVIGRMAIQISGR